MKQIGISLIIISFAFCGQFGIGIVGGSEYTDVDYQTITPERFLDLHYAGEFYLQAEALPNFFLEPALFYLHNPLTGLNSGGVGLRLNVQARIKRFPLAPFFGVEGILLLRNNDDLNAAIINRNLETWIEGSSPMCIVAGFSVISLFLGRNLSVDCHYRYLGFGPNYGVEMAWAGLTYHINW